MFKIKMQKLGYHKVLNTRKTAPWLWKLTIKKLKNLSNNRYWVFYLVVKSSLCTPCLKTTVYFLKKWDISWSPAKN